MIKLIFIVLNDKNSKNTLNILNFLNKYVTVLNKKKHIVEILPVKKEMIDSSDFISFRESNNIKSIPSMLVKDSKGQRTISDPSNISDYLENIIIDKPVKQEIVNAGTDNNIYECSDSDGCEITDKFLEKEINDRSNDHEDVLSTGHSDNTELQKRMKNLKNKKSMEDTKPVINNSNKPVNNYNNDVNSIKLEDEYENKLFNKALNNKKYKINKDYNDDDRLLSSKLDYDD